VAISVREMLPLHVGMGLEAPTDPEILTSGGHYLDKLLVCILFLFE